MKIGSHNRLFSAKKFLIFVTIVAAFIFLGISFGSHFNSELKLKKTITDSLEETYDEEFVCLDVWANGGYSYFGVCYPRSDDNRLFEVLFNSSDGEILNIGYASRILSDEFCDLLNSEIGDELGKHFTYCYITENLNDKKTAAKIKNNELTLNNYFSEYASDYSGRKMQVNYTICFDNSNVGNLSYEDEYDKITNALENIEKKFNKKYGVKFFYRMNLYFVPSDIYSDCIDYFKKHAEIRSDLDDMILGYPERKFKRCIKFDLGSDVFPITKEDYVKQRKEIN